MYLSRFLSTIVLIKAFMSGLVSKKKSFLIKNEVRQAGKSKFGFKKSMNYAVQGIILSMIDH